MSLKFRHIDTQKEASIILAEKIESLLHKNKKVLWLISGGSNIPISVEALKIIKKNCTSLNLISTKSSVKSKKGFGSGNTSVLKNDLAVMLADERYGKIGHDGSNWQQLIDAGFDIDSVHHQQILENLSVKETVKKFNQKFKQLSNQADIIIGQFGLGADGHIAGILPHSAGVNSTDVACVGEIRPLRRSLLAYKFTRISLTLNTIKKIPIVYIFVFGQAKKAIINSLQKKTVSLAEMPAQVLKSIPEAYLYSDMV